jgi:hypothetical protein
MDVFFSTDDPVKAVGDSGQSNALWERCAQGCKKGNKASNEHIRRIKEARSFI